MDAQTILTTEEAAKFLRCSPDTLASWRVRGSGGPAFVRVSKRKVLYLVKDLQDFLHSRRLSGDGA